MLASAFLFAAGGVAWADAWLPTTDLSEPPAGMASSEPQVAADQRGNVIAVWGDSSEEQRRVRARRIGSDGALGGVFDFGSAEQSDSPQVGLDASGGGWLVWRGSVIKARRIAPDGTLGVILDISAPDDLAGFPQVAVDRDGGATVVWESVVFTPGNPSMSLNRVRRIAAEGTLGEVQDLSTVGRVFAPEVVVDDDGVATAAWANDGRIQVRQIDADGTLGPPLELDVGGPTTTLGGLATTPVGVVTVVWSRLSNTPAEGILTYARRIGADGMPAPTRQALSAIGSDALIPEVAVTPAGDATVAWWRRRVVGGGTVDDVQARRLVAGGGLGAIRTLSAETAGDVLLPDVVADPVGNAFVAWSSSTTGTAHARRIAAGGALDVLQDLSQADETGFSTQLAVDPFGNTTAVLAGGPAGELAVVQQAQYVRSPQCQAGRADVGFETPTLLTLDCTGLRLLRQVVSEPANGGLGRIDQGAGTVLYSPAARYSGPDRLQFRATNPGGESATVALELRVASPGTQPPPTGPGSPDTGQPPPTTPGPAPPAQPGPPAAPVQPGPPAAPVRPGPPGATPISRRAIISSLTSFLRSPSSTPTARDLLRSRGYQTRFRARVAGRLRLVYRLRRSRGRGRPTTVFATGAATASRPGSTRITIRPTRRGRSLLRRSRRIVLTAEARFTRRAGGAPLVVRRTVVVRRR